MKAKPDVDICGCNVVHKDIVEAVKKELDKEVLTDKVASFFKVFGDSTRLKILQALKINELCVCDIAALLGMHQSAISHQLRVLKSESLVKNRRDGKVVYYSLDDEHVALILDQGFTHIRHKKGAKK